MSEQPSTEARVWKPCPFCGGTDIRSHEHLGAGRDGVSVFSMCCYECGATFPNRYRRELLKEAWNRRSPEPAAQQWQPVATAPMHRYVLVCNQGGGGRSFIALRNGIGWWDESERMRDPTHWQPLPSPLTKEAKAPRREQYEPGEYGTRCYMDAVAEWNSLNGAGKP